MKKTATLLFLILISLFVHGQTCTPTWPVGGGDGLNPDSAENLPLAYEGTAYSANINFKVPLDTTYLYNGFTVPAMIDSVKIDSVVGLSIIPSSPSFKYVTNPGTGIFRGDSVGCLLITGTPSAAISDTYHLAMYVSAYAYLKSLAFEIQVPETISFYKIIVNYPVGISEVTKDEFTVLNPQPNPAGQATTLTYYMPQPGSVNLKVYSLLGQLVIDKSLNSQGGFNTYNLETSEIPTGQYFYTMTFGNAMQTRELSVVR